MSLEKLRSDICGGIRESFEELICQLAEYEKYPNSLGFKRHGHPDGGIECSRKLSNGKRIGWQAKYFDRGLGKNQWKQIDGSVNKALEEHPDLSKYILCLSVNLNPSQHTKWEKMVEGWQKSAKQKIQFELWEKSKIVGKLHQAGYEGFLLYFLNDEIFSKQWFNTHVENPTCHNFKKNVPLKISKYFEHLGRTEQFDEHIKAIYMHIQDCSINAYDFQREITDNVHKISNLTNKLITKLESDLEEKRIEWEKIHQMGKNVTRVISECENLLIRNFRNKEGRIDKDLYLGQLHRLGKLGDSMKRLEPLYEYKKLEDRPLLLTGSAKVGKTHLLCNVAKKRSESDLPTILTFGSKFHDSEDPLTQIINQIDLRCSRDEFLGALERAAHASGRKAMIIIDAINETEGDLWSRHLKGFIDTVSRYPRISLALSIRSSTKKAVMPLHFDDDAVCEVEHVGFQGAEEVVARVLVDDDVSAKPLISLLIPEFSNPQMLSMMMYSLKNRGLHQLLDGPSRWNMGLFVDSINEKLARELDYDVDEKRVQKSINKLAEKMANDNKTFVTLENAIRMVKEIHPTYPRRYG